MEFLEPDAAGLAQESADEAVTDEETDLGTDWETVPSPRFCDIPSQVRQEAVRVERCAAVSRCSSPPPVHGAVPERSAGVPALRQPRGHDLLRRRLRHLLVPSVHRPSLTPDQSWAAGVRGQPG